MAQLIGFAALGLGFTSLVTVAGCSATTTSGASGDTAQVRVAHVSPDAPSVDFCLAPHGSSEFAVPTLASNGGPTGLAYGNVTRYLTVPADRYDVRLVAPGSSDCATSLGGLPDFTDLPELGAGDTVTIAAEGSVAFGSPTPFALVPYVDDTAVDAAHVKLRFIHASPGTPAVDVGTSGGVLFTPVFTDIAYGAVAAAGDGYVTTPPLDGVEISARPHGSLTDVLSVDPAVIAAGTVATAFAVGIEGNATTPLRVLLCDDTAAPDGLLSSCDLVGGVPERAQIRVAHLSPDAPPVDVCIATTGTGVFAPPLLATIGAQTGLAYPQVSEYVEVPVGTYDLRLIQANASGCSIPAVPDTTAVPLIAGQIATIATLGDLDPSGAAAGEPALHIGLFADTSVAASGDAELRFIHASPGTPAVDVGLGSGSAFVKVFGDVAFGDIAQNPPADALGFVETPAATASVSARLAGAYSDALVVPNVTLPSQGILTAFAIGNKAGDPHPLQVLLCDDNAPPNGLFAACVAAP